VSGEYRVGGLVGRVYNEAGDTDEILYSYANSDINPDLDLIGDTSAVSGTLDTTGSSLESTSNMTDYENNYPETYENWDFSSTWRYGGTEDQEGNSGYPALEWEQVNFVDALFALSPHNVMSLNRDVDFEVESEGGGEGDATINRYFRSKSDVARETHSGVSIGVRATLKTDTPSLADLNRGEIFKWTVTIKDVESAVALYAITPKFEFGGSDELEFG